MRNILATTTPIRRTACFELTLLILFGLLVFTWFQPEHFVLSEDINVPYSPAQWLDMLHAWVHPMNTGSDYSVTEFPGLLFHGSQAALRWLGLSLPAAQKFHSFMWFLLPGFAMHYLMRRIAPGPQHLAARLVASNFYMFNLHLEPIWHIKDVGMLSAYGTLPFALGLFADGCSHPLRRRRCLLWLALVFLLGSGTGINPPAQLVVASVLPLYVLVHLATASWRPTPLPAGVLPFSLMVGGLWVGVNAFWILPQVCRAWQYAAAGTLSTAQALSTEWLQGISTHTSFMNVLRFQGRWTWYDAWFEPYHTYAPLYRTNPWWIALSWFAPLLVVLGMVMVRHPWHLFFTVLTALGVAFGMGLHPPMTKVYLWCVHHIPLFWTIRSPYYKFGIPAALGYAVFIGFVSQRIFWWLRSRAGWPVAIGGLTLIVGLNMTYAFPVTIGRMYATQAERRYLPPNHVQIPEYVWSASRWLDHQQATAAFRVLDLPKTPTWFYHWGLGAGRPVLLQIGRTPILFSAPNPLVPTVEQPILKAFYQALYAGGTDHLGLITRLLNVRYLLHETDLKATAAAVEMNPPSFVQERLNWQGDFQRLRSFGPWDFYAAPTPLPHLYVVPRATVVAGRGEDLVGLAATELLETPACLFTADTKPAILRELAHAGAIDSAVLTPGAAWPQGLPTPPHVTVLVMPQHLMMAVDASKGRRLSWEQGFDPSVPGLDGTLWQDLMTNGETNVTIINHTPDVQRVALSGTVTTYELTRTLYLYLNKNLLRIVKVDPGVRTQVLLPEVILQPGPNALMFYAPEARTLRPDGRQVNFRFADDWQVGPVMYQGVIPVPHAGSWELSLRPGPAVSAQALPPMVWVAGQACAWQQTADGWTTVIDLPAGPAPLTLRNTEIPAYVLLLNPQGQARLPTRLLTAVIPQQASPTAYVLPAVQGPGFLVLSEGYHPGWQATRQQSVLRHFSLQGFANAYWLPAGPAAPVRIQFLSQQWFRWGVALSGGTLLILLVIAAGTVRQTFRRVDKRNLLRYTEFRDTR